MITIITHPGNAHRDELLACAFICASYKEVRIVRTSSPIVEEISSEADTWYVDTGGVYEADTHRFDHHQDAALPPSFVLVARHLGFEAILQDTPWWGYSIDLDTIGPKEALKKRHITGNILPVLSPIEDAILKAFERATTINEHSDIITMLRFVGRSILDSARRFHARIAEFKESPRRGDIAFVQTDDAGAIRYWLMHDPDAPKAAVLRSATSTIVTFKSGRPQYVPSMEAVPLARGRVLFERRLTDDEVVEMLTL